MIKREIFFIEQEEKSVIFVPLKGVIMEINENEKIGVRELLKDHNFSFQDLLKIFPEIDRSRLLGRIPKDTRSKDEKEIFLPTSAVLFTTFNCHLRCIYCYSEAGDRRIKANMDWEIAKSAIDLIIGNTVQQKQEECSIEFHGGGEPTWNWSVFKSSVDYFQTCANRNGLISKVSLVTNGMLSEKQIEWIIGRNIKTIQISLDGPEEIQNVQRPTIGGGKSFSVVFRTIKSFLARGTEIMLHSVVTKDSVDRIPEIVQFFGYNFPHLMVQIEPACPCGRGSIYGTTISVSGNLCEKIY